MSTFNTNAFIIAGTAIAIAGVGLYLWDTRGPSKSSYNTSQSSSNDNFGIPGMSNTQQNPLNSSFGGKRNQKTKNKKNSKKRSVKK
jgi:hypothetical protein